MSAFNRILNRTLRLTTMSLCAALASPAAWAEKLILVNDSSPYCPFTRCENGKNGYVIDVAMAIFQAEGYSVEVMDVPWNRAIAMMNDGSADGILGIAKTSAPKLIYPKAEVAQYGISSFSLTSNSWSFNGIASLNQIRLGLVENYAYGELDPNLKNYLAKKNENIQWVSSFSPLLKIFRMIDYGEIDATLEETHVGKYILQNSGKISNYKISDRINKSPLLGYIAFTHRHPNSQHLAEVFDAGMAKLRKSGQLKIILAAYGMTDWQK